MVLLSVYAEKVGFSRQFEYVDKFNFETENPRRDASIPSVSGGLPYASCSLSVPICHQVSRPLLPPPPSSLEISPCSAHCWDVPSQYNILLCMYSRIQSSNVHCENCKRLCLQCLVYYYCFIQYWHKK